MCVRVCLACFFFVSTSVTSINCVMLLVRGSQVFVLPRSKEMQSLPSGLLPSKLSAQLYCFCSHNLGVGYLRRLECTPCRAPPLGDHAGQVLAVFGSHTFVHIQDESPSA